MTKVKGQIYFEFLKEKALLTRKETLKIHKISKEPRLASSLSSVEIFTVLFYGKILRFQPKNINWNGRDRFIISKGHGAISLYPILSDLGFFPRDELLRVCKSGCILGAIPDPNIPGFETVNGSLGHGLGVASGIALALRNQKQRVFVLLGDGELYEGSVWEAIMFIGFHKLDNIIVIIDRNQAGMLGFCKDTLALGDLEDKFTVFGWKTTRVNGHDIKQLYTALTKFKNDSFCRKPKVIIADTIKGKGVSSLETDPLSHIKNLTPDEVDMAINKLQ